MSLPRGVFTYRDVAPTWRSRRQPGSREIHARPRLTHSPEALRWEGAGPSEPLLWVGGRAGRGRLQGGARPAPPPGPQTRVHAGHGLRRPGLCGVKTPSLAARDAHSRD